MGYIQTMSYTSDELGNWNCTVYAVDGNMYHLQITKQEWLSELTSQHPNEFERVRNRILKRKLAEAMLAKLKQPHC